jgi:hypothetical protein
MGKSEIGVKLGALAIGVLIVIAAPHAAWSAQLQGVKKVHLVSPSGEEMVIGTVEFSAHDGRTSYSLKIDNPSFSEHFLSMRPFRCLEGAAQTVCHLPYPHALRRQVTADDLTDLEYDLLFLHKSSGEYGINFWNGIYYELALGADGTIKGKLKETDMNELASPPAEKFGRLIEPANLSDADGATHRFPTLVIR